MGNYCDAPGLAATNTAQSAGVWWLRSPDSGIGYYTGTVYDDGEVVNSLVNHDWAARPAFNLNSDSILITSAADGGKTDAAVNGNLTEVGTGSAEWKLTLKDTSRSFSASASSTLVRVGENLTVTYSARVRARTNMFPLCSQDNSGNILYYGRIAQNSANGTAKRGDSVRPYSRNLYPESVQRAV